MLGGKFRVERVLGQGGMGVVVAATHLQLDERVALKFLLPTALARPDVVARFAREARAAAKIKSEHIARVTDVGTLPDGSPYMVMEYLEGQDLGSVLRRQGTLSLQKAVEYVLQACEALAEAHALGIVHRDLKPANLFLARERDGTETVKVLDFGISKVADASEAYLTSTTTVLGSPVYMSPEQMLTSSQVDARTDIWSLGVVLHELLTGKLPFVADSMPQLCSQILHGEATELLSLRPDLPPEMGAVLRCCLSKSPAQRWASIGELAVALRPFAPSAEYSIQRILRRQSSSDLSLSLSLSLSTHVTPSAGDQPTLDGHSPLPLPSRLDSTPHPPLVTSTSARSSRGQWLSLTVVAIAVLGAALVLHQRSAPTTPHAASVSSVAAPALPDMPVAAVASVASAASAAPSSPSPPTTAPVVGAARTGRPASTTGPKPAARPGTAAPQKGTSAHVSID